MTSARGKAVRDYCATCGDLFYPEPGDPACCCCTGRCLEPGRDENGEEVQP